MFTPRRLCASSFLCLCLLSTVLGQREQPDNAGQSAGQKASQTGTNVTASATAERVRFTAPSNVVRMQLQVISESGQILFDLTSKGNVLDWSLQDSSGQRLQGEYLTVVTVKTLSGRVSERIGSVLVAEKQVELKSAEATAAALQQAVGPIEENGALTILKAEEAQAITVLANNGSDGQIIRERGALSFRLGDFFSGKDKEQMRLTEDGRLGIGTSDPQAKLDVAGTIRAERVLIAKPGQPGKTGSDNKATDNAQAIDEQSLASGSGTQDRLAKWTETGGAGTLGDSAVFESGGLVGVGTTSPEGTLHIQTPDTTVVKVVSSGSATTGRAVFQMYRGTSAAANGWDFGYNTNLSSEGFVIRELTNGVAATRVAINKGTGNFGIGTIAPQASLQVGATPFNSPNFFAGVRAMINAATNNGGSVPAPSETVLILARDGIANQAYANFARFDLKRYENYLLDSRSQLDVRLSHDNLNYEGNSTPVIMSLQSGGNIGIGTTAPEQKLHVVGNEVLSTGNKSGFKFRDRDSNSDLDDWVWYSDVNIARLYRSGLGDLLYVKENGSVGIGVSPGAKLQVADGDVAVTTQGQGVILRATDGTNCFRVTVNNAGALSQAPVTCP